MDRHLIDKLPPEWHLASHMPSSFTTGLAARASSNEEASTLQTQRRISLCIFETAKRVTGDQAHSEEWKSKKQKWQVTSEYFNSLPGLILLFHRHGHQASASTQRINIPRWAWIQRPAGQDKWTWTAVNAEHQFKGLMRQEISRGVTLWRSCGVRSWAICIFILKKAYWKCDAS